MTEQEGQRSFGHAEEAADAHRALVYSVCRRYLRQREDIEDVAQEIFLKQAKYAASGGKTGPGWLWTAAYTSCIDFVRREESQRRREMGLLHAPANDPEQMFRREAIRQRVAEALLQLDVASRELIVARFYRKAPLRVIASEMGLSVPTMSRRTTAALEMLAAALTDMGINDIDGPGLAEHFGDPGVCAIDRECDGLRFSPDWAQVARNWTQSNGTESLLPGWSRPIRVGLLISWRTTQMWITTLRAYTPPDEQVLSARLFAHPGLQLVAIAEPGTTHLGPIERTVREHELTGGLIDASNAEELRTLDVIVLGRNFVMDDAIARAINQAVRGGTGLLNEYWTQQGFNQVHNSDARDLMLSDSPIYCYHSPRFCGAQSTATVHAEDDRLLPGLKLGMRLMIRECGPAYRPRAGARVIFTRDKLVQPDEHGLSDVGPLPLPGYLLGELGRGRVAVVHCWPHTQLTSYLSIPAEHYFLQLLCWLAAERRGELTNAMDRRPIALQR